MYKVVTTKKCSNCKTTFLRPTKVDQGTEWCLSCRKAYDAEDDGGPMHVRGRKEIAAALDKLFS